MERKSRHQHHSRRQSKYSGFWYELGRQFFPDLAHHPRALRAKMIIMTLGMAALLVGVLVGFYRRANIPSDVLPVQAREINR